MLTYRMTKILVVGCSMTRGHGLTGASSDPQLWVNQLLTRSTSDPVITNLAQTARNNHWIFTETACALSREHYDIVIVGWSELARYNFQVGLETYPTLTKFDRQDISINDNITVSGKWLEELGNNLRKIYNDHWSLLDLVKYVNVLYELQVVARKSKLFFVNTLFNIPNNYFNPIDFVVPSELANYTRMLLNASTRDDAETKELYKLIHDQYNFYGGIQSEHWLNLYNSLRSMQVDSVSSTDNHPGYYSQNIFVNYLTPIFEEKLTCHTVPL